MVYDRDPSGSNLTSSANSISPQSWGGWAGPIHIPTGHVVKLSIYGVDIGATGGRWQETDWMQWPPTSGGTPSPPSPPPSPPPPSGFNATFSGVQGNEWWQQAHVTTTAAIASVDVGIDGGSWQHLTLQNWGSWAASYHAPAGSIVQFRATSTTGATALSSCYHWTDAASTACSGGSTPPPPPPPPSNSTFTATFSSVRGNEWWVESNVAVTGGTLAGADARVNGGTWIALDHQSWGSWANSIHAPTGSTVQFRARATDGSTATSTNYAWPPA